MRGTCEWHNSPCLCARLAVCRLMGDVCSASEFAAFCPLMCAVTMETGALAGTTEMAMLWLGGLMSERGLAGVPTGQLLTASFCHTEEEKKRTKSEKRLGKKEKKVIPVKPTPPHSAKKQKTKCFLIISHVSERLQPLHCRFLSLQNHVFKTGAATNQPFDTCGNSTPCFTPKITYCTKSSSKI